STDSSSTEPVGNKTKLVLNEVSIKQGTKWNPATHIQRVTVDGKTYSFDELSRLGALTYTPLTVDTSKPGDYVISFALDTGKLIERQSSNVFLRKTLKNESVVLTQETKLHVVATSDNSSTTETSTTTSSKERPASSSLSSDKNHRDGQNPKNSSTTKQLPNTGTKITNVATTIIGYLTLLLGVYFIKKEKNTHRNL
ncbi:LPXTG cell wall anchor domain-containing protein, partial [Enterococcus faecalis]